MAYSNEDIGNFISGAFTWRPNGKDFTVIPREADDAPGIRYVSEAELASVDTRLPATVRAILQRSNETQMESNSVPSMQLALTLQHWAHPFPTLTEDTGDVYSFCKIFGLVQSKTDDLTQLKVETILLDKFDDSATNRTISYVRRRSSNRTIFVKTSDLEKSYPDWQSRRSTASALGLSDVELFACLFNVAVPAPSVSLDNVTFE